MTVTPASASISVVALDVLVKGFYVFGLSSEQVLSVLDLR